MNIADVPARWQAPPRWRERLVSPHGVVCLRRRVPPQDADGCRPDIAPVFQTDEEDNTMTMQRSQLTAAGGTRTVAMWYATTTDGDTAVIALPDTPVIWLVHRPHAQVYWQTEGERGLTLSLADARQRLAMVQACGRQERTPVAGHAHHRLMGVTADWTIAPLQYTH